MMNCRAMVDENSCSGHGDCVDAAPSIFRLEEEVAEATSEGPEELLIRAAEACPAGAISVFNLSTGEQVFP